MYDPQFKYEDIQLHRTTLAELQALLDRTEQRRYDLAQDLYIRSSAAGATMTIRQELLTPKQRERIQLWRDGVPHVRLPIPIFLALLIEQRLGPGGTWEIILP
jgi:hypothetical protein